MNNRFNPLAWTLGFVLALAVYILVRLSNMGML